MSVNTALTPVDKPLTANNGDSGRCFNPFCHTMATKRGKCYCSDKCRMDGYVLRRARAMLAEVGTVEFNAILTKDPHE